MILEEQLKTYFHYDTFRPGQKEVIQSVLDGNHTLAMLPTGTGKSLCYQFPGLFLDGATLIVSPLLSLMQDQVEQMKMNGEKKVIAINSFLSNSERKQALSQLNQYKYIFISPEMIQWEPVLEKVKQLKISLFVVDEAHCISQWGYDFRPDYWKLGKIRQVLGQPLTLALTATATPNVREDIVQSLLLHTWKEYIFSVDRPNISISIETLSHHQEKMDRLIELVKQLKGPGIIYFSSKKLAELSADIIKEKTEQRVMPYHGGMDQESRILIQQQFIRGQLDLICATSAFGMGINKENIRYIIHFHMPLQIESYLQEIGRAGRDGGKSIAILLYAAFDEQLSYQLVENELPSEEQIEWLINIYKKDGLEEFMNQLETEQLKHTGGFSDIQWRIFEEFFHECTRIGRRIDERMIQFKAFIKERYEYKRKKVDQVLHWIQLNQCKRELLLHYFSDAKTQQQKDCCDYCGIEKQSFYRENEDMLTHSQPFYWKKHLQTILINSEGEDEKRKV
ncbi:ATP-dependent DNA helicase RecQ [Bacillus sp. 03113]|uniref:RecQ family ATP-dependent DNA helicase n=1 Tax=Bacillus sp. 03113 TaxID=2578211 RepID=UPI0011428AF3|nr:RecQ family ATP-dependent DNA helicase [Bacillus sp. 03113]